MKELTRSRQACGTVSGPTVRRRRSAGLGAAGGGAEQARGAVAVGKRVGRPAAASSEAGEHGGDVVELLAELVQLTISAGAAAAPVHRGDLPAPGEQVPDGFPAFQAAHATVHEQQGRALAGFRKPILVPSAVTISCLCPRNAAPSSRRPASRDGATCAVRL